MNKAKPKRNPPPPEAILGLLLPVPAAALAAGLWLAFVAAAYAKRGLFFSYGDWADVADLLCHVPSILGRGLGSDLLFLAALWAGASGLGSMARCALLGPRPGRLEPALIDAAFGFGSLSLILLGIGTAGFFRPAVLGSLYAAVVVGGGAVLYRGGRLDRSEPAQSPLGFLEGASLAVVALAAALNFVATAAPEVFYDSLVYHLALPDLYLRRGAIVPTPENIYSGLPLGVQMLYGLTLAVSGEKLAALLHASFGLAAAVALFACVRRFAGARAGALAALLFYLCPLVDYASWACGVDLASAFYIVAALCVLTVPDEASGSGYGRAIAAGLLTGFAAGTKLNTLPAAGLLVLAHLWLERRVGRTWRTTAVMASVLAACVFPWLLKNLFFYGNPLYPFLHERLGRLKPADWKAFLEAAGSQDFRAALSTPAGLWGLLSLPFRCSLGDWPLGDWPGPAFVALTPATLFARWRWSAADESPPSAWRLTAALAAAGFAAWALASNLVRYIVPSLPLLAAAAALGVEKAAWPSLLKRAAWGAALIGSLLALQCVYRQGHGIGQWDYLRGKESRAAYLSRQRVTYGLPYYPAAAWINAHTPPAAKVLFIGESRAFYVDRDFIAATVYDHNPFWTAAAAAADEDDLRRRLGASGVTHLLVSVRQLHYRFDSKALFPREIAGGALVDRFMSRWLEKVWEDRADAGEQPRWLVVYALREAAAAGPGPGNPFRVVLDVFRKQGL